MNNYAYWQPWISTAAILIGPFIAILASRYLERQHSERQRKLDIFRMLMRTRSQPISSEHVGALNLVEVEFLKEENVVSAWKNYLDCLGEAVPPMEEKVEFDQMLRKRSTLQTKLLDEMAKSLGIKIPQLEILRGNYVPQGWADDHWERQLERRGWINVLTGKVPFQVQIKEVSQSQPYPPPPE